MRQVEQMYPAEKTFISEPISFMIKNNRNTFIGIQRMKHLDLI